jgi:hypothetical protein
VYLSLKHVVWLTRVAADDGKTNNSMFPTHQHGSPPLSKLLDKCTTLITAPSILHCVISSCGSQEFLGCIMDNTKANRAAMKLLTDELPQTINVGCTAHGLDLILKVSAQTTETRDSQLRLDISYQLIATRRSSILARPLSFIRMTPPEKLDCHPHTHMLLSPTYPHDQLFCSTSTLGTGRPM